MIVKQVHVAPTPATNPPLLLLLLVWMGEGGKGRRGGDCKASSRSPTPGTNPPLLLLLLVWVGEGGGGGVAVGSGGGGDL